ncbi:hypothetical protein L9F63_013846, partial [Diploptera punctata]
VIKIHFIFLCRELDFFCYVKFVRKCWKMLQHIQKLRNIDFTNWFSNKILKILSYCCTSYIEYNRVCVKEFYDIQVWRVLKTGSLRL